MRAVVALVLSAALVTPAPPLPGRGVGPVHQGVAVHDGVAVATPSADELARLPEARYDAVIPGLDIDPPKRFTGGPTMILTLDHDVALYPTAKDHAVARLAARNFLGHPTVVLAYPPRRDGWQLVLTPARRQLPSAGPGAIAQSYGWIRADTVPTQAEARYRVEISVPRGRLSITGPGGPRAFPADVGGRRTPTPTGVVGYLQARYLDPAQGQSSHRIQLTSLHATAADEPYGGDDGGLIGLHFGSGSSHGCVRLGVDAIAALDDLPLGTPVRIVGAGDGE
ncbi:MAG TPA: L,D-transpeptidase family protein [Pseudolysinimonas sp.]|jgi:hypothetical protein|nr:L,D-transpeptidase family protein [Pseudolysinimonas sp.]